jgi:hypothetical protein
MTIDATFPHQVGGCVPQPTKTFDVFESEKRLLRILGEILLCFAAKLVR